MAKIKNILVACDSFKDSISSSDMNNAIKDELKEYNVKIVNVSDGGEGFARCLGESLNLEKLVISTFDALKRKVESNVYIDRNSNVAFLDLASSVGIEHVEIENRTPLTTHTFGLGHVIKQLYDLGFKEMYIGIGGSVTHDCGVGVLEAFGVEFFDAEGIMLEPIGLNIGLINKINLPSNFPTDLEINFATDVSNTVCGIEGASNIFAKQKGASEAEIKFLESSTLKYIKFLEKTFDIEITSIKGGGASGGIVAGLYPFFKSNILSGADLIKEKTELLNYIQDCDIVITGEGKFDLQSAYGKIPYFIVENALKLGKKAIIIAGVVDEQLDVSDDNLHVYGFVNNGIAPEISIKHPKSALNKIMPKIIEVIESDKLSSSARDC